MKNKKKKRTSSYLLIFLSIVAVVLLLIILYLTFFGKNSLNNKYLAKNESGNSQALDSDSDETAGFTSGDEDLDADQQDGFISGDEASGNESSNEDIQGPSQKESAGPSQASSDSDTIGPSQSSDSEVAGPSQSSETEQAGSSQSTEFHSKGSEASPSETDNSRKTASSKTQDNSNGKDDSTAKADTTPEISDDGAISPSHGSSAFDNRSDEKMDTLISQINSQLPTGNGSWSVYICDLAGGSEASINDTPMQAASLIKLFIMGAVYEDYDALSQQYGSATLDGYLTPMITVSDNDAANSLVSCLGGGDSTAGMQKVNSFCQAHGYTSTSMGRLLLASNEFGDNYTSAYDCGKFLKEIYQICAGTAQSQSLSHAEDMYALLKQQQRSNKIPATLPEGVSVANKTGELSDVENDAGILYNTQGGNDLVIVFLSQNLTSAGDAQSTIAQLSRSIYLYYND
ncbi:serine hydrolase [Blautia sp. Sow4_E7]|uniref:serine hydrolase n=1 Tax=Blautia sp. Sow4_E7 TaxID=3438749 RepID=UPI003F93F275